MDDNVYYWELLDLYCYRSELEDYVEKHGHDYTAHLSSEFFATIWIDKEK